MSEGTMIVPDPARVEEMAGKAFGYLTGTVVSIGVWLGDQLGIYRAMAGAGPLTSDALAARTGLNERWVREWLSQQAAAGLIEHRGDLSFELSPEGAIVLADESTMASAIGMFGFLPAGFSIALDLPECFRTGLGRKYDAHGESMAKAMQRASASTNGLFTDVAIPALEGVAQKLEAGGKVADIGCGAGGRLIAAAQLYPHSSFHGYDISEIALDIARQEAASAGVRNIAFHNPDSDPLPADGSFDLVTFGDVVHDLAFPDRVLSAVRQSLKPDGTVLVIDFAAGETLEDNLAHPMAPLFYGFSQLVCMSSSLSEAGGAGIGTLGLSPSRLKSLCEGAGFTRFRITEVADPMNSYYEIRP